MSPILGPSLWFHGGANPVINADPGRQLRQSDGQGRSLRGFFAVLTLGQQKLGFYFQYYNAAMNWGGGNNLLVQMVKVEITWDFSCNPI